MTSDTSTTTTVLKERIGSVDTPLGKYTENVLLLREKTVLKLQDDSVCVEESVMTSGETKSGKRWYRWKTTRRMTAVFRSRQNGPRRIYAYDYVSDRRKVYEPGIGHVHKVVTKFKDCTPDHMFWRQFFSYSEQVFVEFSSRVEKYFPYIYKRVIKMPESIYGGVNKVEFALFSAYPAAMDRVRGHSVINDSRGKKTLTCLREETYALAVKKLFGTKYRKSLVAVENESSHSSLVFSYACKNIVPIDWIVDGLRTSGHYMGAYPYVGDNTSLYAEDHIFNRILLTVSSGRRKDFFVSCFGSDVLDDVCRMYEWNDQFQPEYDILIRNSRDVENLHDEMVRLQNRQKQADRAAVTIPLTEVSSTYNEMVVDNRFKIVAPENGQTLYDWSALMGNCISGYVKPAKEGTLHLGAVYEGEKLIANFEIDKNKNLKQLLGKYNQPLTQEDRDAIIDALASVEAIHIDTVTQAWGVTDYTPTEQRMIEA